MSRERRRRATVLLSQRALEDIRGIEVYSIEQWGARVAARYLDDLEAGIARLAERPELARGEPEFHAALRFYRVNKHLLVCDVDEAGVLVLTVVHASVDLPRRLAELQPKLAAETQLLREQFQCTAKRRPKRER